MDYSRLEIRVSNKLKKEFEDMCKEREISTSNALRDLMTNSVRNHKRQNVKAGEKEQ